MTSIILGISNTLCGSLLILLSVPLLHGKVGRNLMYGARFKESLASDEAWLAINRYGAKLLIFWGVLLILLGGITFLLQPSDRLTILLIGLAPVSIVIPAFQTWRFGRQFTRQNQH